MIVIPICIMRRIDYWLGVPLCFLLTGVNYVLRFIAFRKKKIAAPRKILFVKLSEMGSIILASPFINQVRKEFPKAEIFFLTFKKNASIFKVLNITSLRNILTIREESFHPFILDTLRAIKKVRKERIDIVFDLELFSRFTAIFTYLSGALKKVGFYRYTIEGLYRGNLLTHKIQYNPLIHISKSYLSLWQASGTRVKTTPALERKIEDKEFSLPKFISSQNEINGMRQKLRQFQSEINEKSKLLLLNPGEGRIPLREWPLENFITLAGRLLEESDTYIIIVGISTASKKAQLLWKSVNNKRCLCLTDNTTVFEVLSLCSIAKALIANDSGLAHLASLTPVKKFIFFGPESPCIYSPLGGNTWILYSNLPCSPCLSAFNHRNSACGDNKCLKAIGPGEVYKLIMENL